jgi:hypothetical protein
VKNDTVEISIKNYFYYYMTCEMVICDCDGMTGNYILHQYEQYWFFQQNVSLFFKRIQIIEVLHNSNNFFCLLHFELTSFYSNNNNNNNKIVMCHLHLTLGLLILNALFGGGSNGITWSSCCHYRPANKLLELYNALNSCKL